MLRAHTGGEVVRGGIYWRRSAGELTTVPREGGPLPGAPTEQYVETPLLAVLLVGPLLGLAFAIFLPLSGFLVLGQLLLQRLRSALPNGETSREATTQQA